MLSLIAIVASNAMAEEYSYEFQAKAFSTTGTQSLNNVNWTLNTDAQYFGYDGTKGQQIGSASKPGNTITLTTSDIKGPIKSVVVNTSGAKDIKATLTVSVGETTLGNPYSLTSSAEEATFTGEATGEIKLNYNQTSSKAIYIKSIKVIYGNGEVPEPPTPPVTRVNSIAEFNALPNGTETTIYLSDDMNARVTHVHEKNVYLRDKTGAICFYNFEKASAMVYNQHIAGYIIGKKSMVGNLPILESTAQTNTALLIMAAPVMEENVEPKEITVSQLTQNYADWVIIKDVTMQDETNGSDKTGSVQIVNSFNADKYITLQPNNQYTISGIVNSTTDSPLMLTPIYNKAGERTGNPSASMTAEYLPVTVTTGIEAPINRQTIKDMVIYDMMGRRIKPEQMKKGVYIVNGKKLIK